MSMLLAHTLRRFPKEMFVRTMELLATAPEFLDTHGDVVEQRVQRKCGSRISARAIGNQLRCLAASEVPQAQFRISSPTLVVAGEYDPIIPGCYAQRMAEKIPGSTYYLAPGAGHNPMLDHPHLVLPKIIDFLRPAVKDATVPSWMESFVPDFGGSAPPMEGCARR
jgi:pimeloyl-ACP methyl ester carboxylesterase